MWSRIVCLACEQSFGADDEYLIATYNRLDDCPAAFDGDATLLPDVDAMRLQRSILSEFFRAHLSDHVAFREVDLGVHAQGLRTFLFPGRCRHLRKSRSGCVIWCSPWAN